MLNYKDQWRVFTADQKREWAELAGSNYDSFKQLVSIGGPALLETRIRHAQALIDMGKTRSKNVETVERQLFGGGKEKAA